MAQETFVLGIYMYIYIYIPLYTLDMGLNIWVTGIPSTNLAVLQGEKKGVPCLISTEPSRLGNPRVFLPNPRHVVVGMTHRDPK